MYAVPLGFFPQLEIWKDILHYKDKYQISNYGRVISLNYRGHGYPQVLKTGVASTGYKTINLCPAVTKSPSRNVHRLVAEAFIPNPHNYPEVNHMDETRYNNNVWNLEWVTHKQNINYGTTRARIAARMQKPVLQMDMQFRVIQEWESASDAARKGYSRPCINGCCLNKRRTHRGYIWRYKE